MRGGAFHLRSPHVLADNGLVHAETLELFAEIFAGRYRTPLPEIVHSTKADSTLPGSKCYYLKRG